MPAHSEEEVLSLMLQEVNEALNSRLESFADITADVIEGGLTPEYFASGIRDDVFWQEELMARIRELSDERLARELFALEKRRIDSENTPQSKKDAAYAQELEELEGEFERATRLRDDERRQQSDYKIAKRMQKEYDKENAISHQANDVMDAIIKKISGRQPTKEVKIGFFRRIVKRAPTREKGKEKVERALRIQRYVYIYMLYSFQYFYVLFFPTVLLLYFHSPKGYAKLAYYCVICYFSSPLYILASFPPLSILPHAFCPKSIAV